MKRGSIRKADIKSALATVQKALDSMQVKIKEGSASDLVRLLQLRHELVEELSDEQVQEIRVTWVEPKPESVSDK